MSVCIWVHFLPAPAIHDKKDMQGNLINFLLSFSTNFPNCKLDLTK